MIAHIFVVFYTMLKNAKGRRLLATLFFMATPVSFIVIAVLLAINKYIFFLLIRFNVISIGFLVGITMILVIRWLSLTLRNHGREIIQIADKLSRTMIILNIFIAIIIFLGSIFLVLASLRFIR